MLDLQMSKLSPIINIEGTWVMSKNWMALKTGEQTMDKM